MKKKINTRIIVLDTAEKIVGEMIRVGNRLAHYEEQRWTPCTSVESLDWNELVKAYKALKRKK